MVEQEWEGRRWRSVGRGKFNPSAREREEEPPAVSLVTASPAMEMATPPAWVGRPLSMALGS